jgi:hypothetical protein
VTPARGSRARRRCPGVPACLGLAFVPVGVCLLAPSEGRAQSPRVELDLSATRIEYDTLGPLDAPSLSALAEWQRPSLFGRLSGSVTGFEDAGWSVQGRANLAGWLSPFGILSPIRLELAGAASGSRYSRGFDSFVARTDARVHLRGRRVGAWAGAGLATGRNSFDEGAVGGVVPGVGVWTQAGSVRATASYLHTTVSGESYPEANLALTLSRGAVDLTVYGGLRQSPFEGTDLDERWAGVSGALWLTDHAALVVSGGKYGADVLQGLPGGDFVSVGLRLTPRRARPIPDSAPAPIVYSPEAIRTGGVGFRVRGASRVEIAGDWNGWIPEPLSRDGSGRWVLPTALGPGVYRFNLRVDGDRWMVPEEVPSLDDGYGGRVGLLIVSESE